LSRKFFAQVQRLSSGLFSFVPVPQVGVGLTQPSVCQGEIGIFLGGRLKALLRLDVLSLMDQLHALAVVAKSLDRLGRRLERLSLKFLDRLRGQRQTLFHGLS